jgi:hypothetical protein
MNNKQINILPSKQIPLSQQVSNASTSQPAPGSVSWISAQARSRSPQARSRSPQARSLSPQARSRSPQARSQSPQARSRSPQARSSSPQARSSSPKNLGVSPASSLPAPGSESGSGSWRAASATVPSLKPAGISTQQPRGQPAPGSWRAASATVPSLKPAGISTQQPRGQPARSRSSKLRLLESLLPPSDVVLEEVYNLDYEQYKQNVLEMIRKDYYHHLHGNNYTNRRRIQGVMATIESSNDNCQKTICNIWNLLKNELWKHGINAHNYKSNADKVFLHITNTTKDRELKVVSYYGSAQNPIKGDQNLDEVGFPARTAEREFNEETNLSLRIEDNADIAIIDELGIRGPYIIISIPQYSIQEHHVIITLSDDDYLRLKEYFLQQKHDNRVLDISEINKIYMKKYLKYKNKYLNLKNI